MAYIKCSPDLLSCGLPIYITNDTDTNKYYRCIIPFFLLFFFLLEVTWKVNARLGICNLFTFFHTHQPPTFPTRFLFCSSFFPSAVSAWLRIRHVLHDQINNKLCKTQQSSEMPCTCRCHHLKRIESKLFGVSAALEFA